MFLNNVFTGEKKEMQYITIVPTCLHLTATLFLQTTQNMIHVYISHCSIITPSRKRLIFSMLLYQQSASVTQISLPAMLNNKNTL